MPQERILVVDDEELVLEVVSGGLQEGGYFCQTVFNGEEALQKLSSGEKYNLALVDYNMPKMNGLELIQQIRLHYPEVLPVLMTAQRDVEVAVKALKEGAYDYIGKPFDLEELLLSVKRALRHQHLEIAAKTHEERLEKSIQERSQQLAEQIHQSRENLNKWIQTLEEIYVRKHPFARGHVEKVSLLSEEMARLSSLPEEEIEKIKKAAHLYHLGKLSIPDSILEKEGSLSGEEEKKVQEYIGFSVRLASVEDFKDCIPIIENHRERPDGKGYPAGLEREIPLSALILGLCDAFIAMVSPRPYREAKSLFQAQEEISQQKGKQFDPSLVDLLLSYLKKSNHEHNKFY